MPPEESTVHALHQHVAAGPQASSFGGFFTNLFQEFTPRQACMFYDQSVIWLHVISDSLIAAAYYSIPIALVYFVLNRRDLKFNWIFLLFASFILACGTTHLFSVWAIWQPLYRLDGLVKFFTGAISMTTAVVLWPLIPKALALPSPAQLEVANRELRAEIAERERIQEELREAKEQLEERVRERTAELQLSHAQLEAVFDAVADGVVTIDADGTIESVNRAAEKIFRFTEEEMIGKKFEYLFPETLEPGWNEYVETLTHAIGSSRREALARSKDGDNIPAELALVPIRLQDRFMYAASIRDVSVRRQWEDDLRASEERFRGTFENAAVGVAQSDLLGRYLMVNHRLCEMLGYALEEMLGRSVSDITHPEDVERDLQELDNLVKGEKDTYSLDKRYVRKDGSILWINLTASLIGDRNAPETLRRISIVQDISARKRAEDQLRKLHDNLERQVAQRTAEAEGRAEQLRLLTLELSQAEQRERRRIASILHDHIQQLMVAAKMRTEALRGREMSESINKSVMEIHQLLDEAIQSSRSLTIDLSPPILYEGGLADAFRWLARRFQQNYGLKVAVEERDNDEGSLAEEMKVMLFQTMRELLQNVVKHAGVDEAEVRLSYPGEHEVEIVVRDAGVGFDIELLETGALESESFGLFSIKERLEMIGGGLALQSAPDGGTTATIRAPRKWAQRPAQRFHPHEEEMTGGEQERIRDGNDKIRVLIADDHQILREGLASLLEEHPDIQLVGMAADGRMAVELAKTLKPDVVIMDITMPELNGIDATELIKRAMPNVRVIGLSMHEEEDMANRMMSVGASEYLVKDGPANRLLDAIRRS